MRTLYLVTYDISNPRRLRRIYKIMRGFGDPVQLSVFRCELSDRERAEMIMALDLEIHHRDDQILIVPLGPPKGLNAQAITTLGRTLAATHRHAIVI